MFIHETAIVDDLNSIGDDTKVWHYSHVMSSSVIGKNCSIGQNCFVGENVKIGDNVKVQNNVSLFDGVEVESNVFIGPSVVFTNVNKPRSEYPTNKIYDQTTVKEGASIGANSTIICGVVIGNYSFIGAGSIITKNVPNYALVVGNPGKIIGWVGESGERLIIDNEIGKDPILDHKFKLNYVNGEIESIEKI